MQNKEKKQAKHQRLTPDSFDGFIPPANFEALKEHLEYMRVLRRGLVRLSLDRTAGARDPWFRNGALQYVVEKIEEHDDNALPAAIILSDYLALRAALRFKQESEHFAPLEYYGSEDGRSPARNAGLEWRKRFAWAISLSLIELHSRQEQVTPAEWRSLHGAILTLSALTAGHHTVDAWRAALVESRRKRHARNVKGGHERLKPYHDRVRVLAGRYLRLSPHANATDVARHIISDLQDWIDEECDLSPEPKPSRATVARFLKNSGVVPEERGEQSAKTGENSAA